MSIGLLVVVLTAGGNDPKNALAFSSTTPLISAPQIRISHSPEVPLTDSAPYYEPAPVFLGGEFVMGGIATHYGEQYNGSGMACGGVYSSLDPTIIAIGPSHYGEWPCGTTFQVCGILACMVVTRTDSCPGCVASVFDLSEAGIGRICGEGASTCDITLQPGQMVVPSQPPQ